MKRIAWILGTALLAVFVLLMLLVSLVPREALKTQVGEQIAAWTGRDVSLRGAPELDIFPSLAVTLKDVQVGGPAAMSEAAIISMERLRSTIRLLPLIIGRVEIGSFTMVRPLIRLVRDEKGARNWAFDSSAAALQLAFAGDVPLGDFVLEDGTLIYENRQGGVKERFDSVNLRIDWPSVRQPLAITGSGIWRGEEVVFSTNAAAPFDFLNGEATPIHAQLDSVPVVATFTGAAADPGSPQLRGALTMATPSLRGFANWLGNPAGPGSTLGPASLSGTAVFREAVLSVENAKLALDGNNAAGALEIVVSSVPTVTGTLALQSLDLTSYFDGLATDLGSGRDWRDIGVETDWFRDLAADIRLSAGSVAIGAMRFGQTAASISLRDARLAIGIGEAAFSGGSLSGDLSMTDEPDRPGAAMQAKLRGADIDLAAVAPVFGLPERLSGKAVIATDIGSAGETLGSIVRGLTGTGRITVQGGSLPLFGIGELAVAGGGDVSAKPFGLTPVVELFAGFSFAGGTAILEQSRVVASGFSADAKGWIALIDGSLGLNGTVQPKRPGVAVPPPMPFTIDGTLARPVARPLALAN